MSSQLDNASDNAARDKIAQAENELAQLEKAYAEMAADATLMAGSMAPPPWGTAADVASIGKSLWAKDWGGALIDVVGVLPLGGDAAKGVLKGTKLAAKMDEVADSLKLIRATLARRKAALIGNRKKAAQKYWADIKAKGKAKYDAAIKKNSTKECIEDAAKFKGPQYQYTPKSGKNGNWDGERGDGKWIPTKDSPLDKALKEYNQKHKTKINHLEYKDGFPDYDDFIPVVNGKKARVEIPQKGGDKDFGPADDAMREMLGDPNWTRPKDYTWHHKEDGVTMELVPTPIHGFPESGHLGGTSTVKKPEF